MTIKSAEMILKSTFGYDNFRGRQLDIIEKIIAGKNVLTVMPTGAGKSLCFQIPALIMEGLTIVVSPLISLMQNQVEALKLIGIKAASINSTNSIGLNREIWEKINKQDLKILYVSPEKLMTEEVLNLIDDLQVNLFAIDEAHCISQWGAAFRPEYEELGILHVRYPNTPIIALTATADKMTREQICKKIFSDDVTTYLEGFDRPNIKLNVEIKKGWKNQLLSFMKGRSKENGIIYCLSRKKTEEAAQILVRAGFNALCYHAGMAGDQREENLNRFMTEPDLVMVATIAFGMGIDKPDIRFVFHTDMPGSPEAYYQEIGRAGRDGESAEAHMLYGLDDIRMRRVFIDNEDASDQHRRRGHQRLNSLLSYCEAPACRRKTLLSYFGDNPGFEKCDNCDLCLNPRETKDATVAGQKFISAMYRTGQNFGVGHIVDILRGNSTEKVCRLSHEKLPTFAVGQEFGVNEWKSIARQLMAREFINTDIQYGSLKITDTGYLLLKGEENFNYLADLAFSTSKKTSKTSKTSKVIDDLKEGDQDLYLQLKELRKTIAAKRTVPAYIIFSDKSLVDMALNKPITLEEFGEIFGVGEEKKKKFGKQFIELIKLAH
ncbi:DNA helicase RecQ [Emcibacteraceae bacterium]|nr:DNA helicase RecQ [Emcibacteraceae bacterium]